MAKASDKISLSKSKVVNIGLLIVAFNPLPSGLIYGIALWRGASMKKEGNLIIIFSLLWGAVALALARKHFGI
ncbi:hypothetical protein MYX06_03900 [Patescibacteria group bacterium AH-259-L05]|nr:hypothetical protein [Patescibacteria group bacterium AH-259-L05]